jgi:hypothetical protein
MNKLLIAAAAVATLAAGTSAAQAKVHFDVHLGGYGYAPGFYAPVYEPVTYYGPSCHWVKIKKVKWVYGEKVIVIKKKKVCDYGY